MGITPSSIVDFTITSRITKCLVSCMDNLVNLICDDYTNALIFADYIHIEIIIFLTRSKVHRKIHRLF